MVRLITMLSEFQLRYKSDNHKTDGRLYSAASGSPPPNPAAVVGASGFSKLFRFLSRLPALDPPPSSSMTLADLSFVGWKTDYFSTFCEQKSFLSKSVGKICTLPGHAAGVAHADGVPRLLFLGRDLVSIYPCSRKHGLKKG